MLKLLKLNNKKDRDKIIAAVEESAEEIELQHEETLPPISLFISVDQLTHLKDKDEDREYQAKMFLKSKEDTENGHAVYAEYVEKFEKSFSKLGNENKECPHCRREYTSMPIEIKKCLGCSKAFFKTKRPQDGMTVLVREENRELLSMQWENIRKAELIERINELELEKIRSALQEKSGTRQTLHDAHFLVVKQHVSKALVSGRFRLYSSLIYYMAEHDRYRTDFAQALTYYFYLYYLQLNGASNSVVFGDRVSVNIRTIDRISSLLKMASLLTTECEELFVYSIEKLSAFDMENLPYSVNETYAHLVKTFEKPEGREKIVPVIVVKPTMKSFRLQR